MADAKPKTIATMKLSATCPAHARSDISVRDVELVIDEPKERGGTNLGPTPTETLVASLIGCTNVIANRIAEKAGIHIARMDIEAAADFDRRGVMLEAELDTPFPSITLDITVHTDADEGAFEVVKRDLPKYCPVSKVIRGSGTEITETWTLKRP